MANFKGNSIVLLIFTVMFVICFFLHCFFAIRYATLDLDYVERFRPSANVVSMSEFYQLLVIAMCVVFCCCFTSGFLMLDLSSLRNNLSGMFCGVVSLTFIGVFFLFDLAIALSNTYSYRADNEASAALRGDCEGLFNCDAGPEYDGPGAPDAAPARAANVPDCGDSYVASDVWVDNTAGFAWDCGRAARSDVQSALVGWTVCAGLTLVALVGAVMAGTCATMATRVASNAQLQQPPTQQPRRRSVHGSRSYSARSSLKNSSRSSLKQ